MAKRAVVLILVMLLALTACDVLSPPSDEDSQPPEDASEEGMGFEPEEVEDTEEEMAFEPEEAEDTEEGMEFEPQEVEESSEAQEEPAESDADLDAELEASRQEQQDQLANNQHKIPISGPWTLYYNGGTITCNDFTMPSQASPPEQGLLTVDEDQTSLTMSGAEIQGELYLVELTNNGSVYQGFVDGPEGTLINYELQYVDSELSPLNIDDTAIAYDVFLPEDVTEDVHIGWLIGTFDLEIQNPSGGGVCSVHRNFVGVEDN